ncbi:MAG: DUF1854 domain-containing protein [Clostridia bacterium]|nr:DUF1854 domain-containing protein [Clostridia bacterium]
MARISIKGDEVRFVRKDSTTVDAIFFDGNVLEDLEPRRLFPVSGGNKYITLLDKDNKEQAVIRDVDALIPESREIILACLSEYYMIPRILKVLDRTEKFGILKWTVETERGTAEFTIQNRHNDIKIFYDGRVLVRDSNDNRYEIPDYRTLDRHSLKLLGYDL